MFILVDEYMLAKIKIRRVRYQVSHTKKCVTQTQLGIDKNFVGHRVDCNLVVTLFSDTDKVGYIVIRIRI